MLSILFLVAIIHSVFSIQYDEPTCKIIKDEEAKLCFPQGKKTERLIAVGDIHGSYNGLLEVLFYANITTSRTTCSWRQQDVKTVFVQVGDVVDRGDGSYEAFECLRSLQNEASKFNGEVIRLFGNHDMWWLTGYTHERHKQADTRAKITNFVKFTKDDILQKKVLGAYVHTINRMPILFVHAGYSQAFLTLLKKTNAVPDINAKAIANYTNLMLRKSMQKCRKFPCQMTEEIFEAGPDRGGKGVGGPFWTDFDTIAEGVLSQQKPTNFIQVVGHTMAFCYSRRHPNVHPPDTHAECGLGLIRSTADLSAYCVDGGMYLGARTFLEIGTDGHFRSFERRAPEGMPFTIKDFTAQHCELDCTI